MLPVATIPQAFPHSYQRRIVVFGPFLFHFFVLSVTVTHDGREIFHEKSLLCCYSVCPACFYEHESGSRKVRETEKAEFAKEGGRGVNF